jgi:hypothetical protein
VFTDAGQVWTRQAGVKNLGFTRLSVTPGAGVRVSSPVGTIVVNAGYNPYGSRSEQAYFPDQTGNAPLICVSPGASALLVRRIGGPSGNLVQDAGDCPATFQQPQSSSFFSKLRFSISIGTGF